MNNEIMSAAHGSGLTYPSVYKICKHYAEEAEWMGENAEYWKAEAKYFQHLLYAAQCPTLPSNVNWKRTQINGTE